VTERHIAIIEAIVIGRLVDPGSERYTKSWAEDRSAIYELTGGLNSHSLNTYYRAGDKLFISKDTIETHLSKREKEMFALPEQLCFFDLTNTYLEGQALNNPKAKRGRSDCKLLTLAMVVDEHGFVKYSQLYTGNKSDCKTLEVMVESLKKLRPDISQQHTVIMDAGIATKENIEYLKGKEIKYIVVNRGKGSFIAEDTNDMRVMFKDDDKNFKIEVKRQEKNGETWLLCRSTGRRHKEGGIRGRQEINFLNELEKTRVGLTKKGCTKKFNRILEKIGRLRQKYPKASKVYDNTVEPDGDKLDSKTVAKDIIWNKRDQYDAEVKYEGCYVLRTNCVKLSDEEIWKTYVMLTRIERAFRCLKMDLGLRPVYHQIEFRSDTHMFATVLSYHILNIIEYRLRMHGDHRSWNTIRNILSTHQRLTIEFKYTKKGIVNHGSIRTCSLPEKEHQLIYYRLGLSDLPLRKVQNL